ncbi:MAG TPA: HAMP domain-containing sensor histidine kinase [Thermoanaerobaculia bacterium]|nr:HAMP domain-containing sensor histidine kinase [Thermoanaerobaculia bacterium]
MTERTLLPGKPVPVLHRSIFVKLVIVMLATAAGLTITVIVLFELFVKPGMATSRSLFAEYTRVLASTSPDLATAKRLAESFGFEMRYEGPAGDWETAPGLPSVQEVREHPWWHDSQLAPAPDGGAYVFFWDLGRRTMEAHDRMMWLLLALMIGIVLLAYVVLRRSLRPVRSLHEGVVRLSEGHLDVVVPSRTSDELGALTDAFNQMVRRIQEMLRARDQLLLDVSHELRSPLTRMKVALALLPEGDKSRQIAADVAEMEAMITELLELERLRDGRGVRTERQDLVPILREVAESFQGRPPGVRFIASQPEIFLDVDRDPMRTVLRNLLENAIKYSLPDSAPVEVAAGQEGETVTVRVTDDGPGIPEADLASLFEPFFRVDRSRSKKTGGYGLGLSICKRIVESHGGGITVENNVENSAGRGATFRITLRKPA